MKTVLICHTDSELTCNGFAAWMGSFSDLIGIIQIEEKGNRTKQRVDAEIRRIGYLRFLLDVLPYRVYYKLFLAHKDHQWELDKSAELMDHFGGIPSSAEVLVTDSPNSAEVRDFLLRKQPDMVIARCKTLIKKEIYTIPSKGILILHPGICPEYRNSHGCFWALANQDYDKVGATLLKIDDGVDTGPIYNYFTYDYDARNETPNIIHNRVVYDNLPEIQSSLMDIYHDKATRIDITGRPSHVWGQPWLSKYLFIKMRGGKK